MTDLAELVVKLRAEISDFTSNITKATNDIKGFATNVGDSIAFIAKSFAALYAIKEVFSFGEKLIESAASFNELSHAVGLSTEALSAFSYAAKLQGIDDITGSLEKLAKSAGNVAEGNAKATSAYQALGVSIYDTNGAVKGTQQLLLEVSDAFSKYADGITKTKIAQELFGRSGAKDIAFLDQGSKKILAEMQEAIDFGNGVSASYSAAAKHIVDDSARIEGAITGVFNRALKEVIPQIEEATHQTAEFAKTLNGLPEVNDAVTNGLKLVIGTFVLLTTTLEVLIREFVLLVDVAIDINKISFDLFTGNIKQVGKDFDEMKNDVVSGLQAISLAEHGAKDIIVQLAHTRTQAEKDAQAASDAATETANQKLKQLNLPNEKIQKGIESAIEALSKLDAKLRESVATYGTAGAAAVAYSLTFGELASQIERLNKMPKSEAHKAVEELGKAGKLTADQVATLNDEIDRGVKIGTDFKDKILESAIALDKLKAGESLTKLDSELLKITGHFDTLAADALDLSTRPVKIVIEAELDKNSVKGLSDDEKQLFVNSKLSDINRASIEIQHDLKAAIDDVEASRKAGSDAEFVALGKEAQLRSDAIAQLEDQRAQQLALFEATGSQDAIDSAEALAKTISGIRFGADFFKSAQEVDAYLQKIADDARAQQAAEEAFAVTQSANVADRAAGRVNDLELMGKQDEAVNTLIASYEKLLQSYEDLHAKNPLDPDVVTNINRTIVAINNLKATTNQLIHEIRGDFEDAASNAFTSFATGAQTASQAFHNFINDISSRLIKMGSDALFQNIFGSIAGDDSPLVKALTGGKDAAAQTAAATTAATVMSTGITTGGVTAGVSMQSAITIGGQIAADAMALAITTASAAGAGAKAGADVLTEVVITATKAATGGPVTAGAPYLIGEEGPELMVPDSNGTIIPNGRFSMGGGVNVVNHFHIEAPRGTVSRATQGQIAAQVAMSVALGARNN